VRSLRMICSGVWRLPSWGFSCPSLVVWEALKWTGSVCGIYVTGCSHAAIVSGGKHLSELPQFRWISTLLGNLKTSFNATFHAFNFDKYTRRYLNGN